MENLFSSFLAVKEERTRAAESWQWERTSIRHSWAVESLSTAGFAIGTTLRIIAARWATLEVSETVDLPIIATMVVDYRNNGVISDSTPLSDAELATFSCSYTTAEGMLSRAQVGQDDIILITGASGGVGSALVQLAKRRGAQVVALASEAKHEELATRLVGKDGDDNNAVVLLPRAPTDLKASLRQTIGRETVTVVADIVGGASVL